MDRTKLLPSTPCLLLYLHSETMSTQPDRAALIHSVSFTSLPPAVSGEVGVEYDELSGWSKEFPSIGAASVELSIPAESIGKAMKQNTSLYTIVPMVDNGELLTPKALIRHTY